MKHNTPFHVFALTILTIGLITPGGKSLQSESEHGTAGDIEAESESQIVAQIIESDDHSNAVTNIEPSQFTALRWELGDTLEVTFEDGQKIRCLYISNYGDVPTGDYLVRFSRSQNLLKIAINEGYLAQALKIKSPSQVTLRRVQLAKEGDDERGHDAAKEALDKVKQQQKSPLAPRPEIYDVQHFKLHYDEKTYCGHPRQAIFKSFSDREIVVGHNHALCNYQVPSDVRHDLGGYHSRAVALLQRSVDGGATWPEGDDVTVYDETMSSEEKRAFLYQKGAPREQYDMFQPESVFFFGRTYLPEDRGGVPVCFALRSPDKGRTWEEAPTIIKHPDGEKVWVHKDCHPVVRMPDGKTLLAAMSIAQPGGPAIYASTDNGIMWNFLSRVAVDRRFTYAGLLLSPNGDLQCYFLHIARSDQIVDGLKNAICMSVSKDSGETWSAPVPIVGTGGGCWKDPRGGGVIYRSPWPMQLKDGRILVVFARRRLPMGIGGVLSSDGGVTWSEEFVIRDDASHGDLGYPVGCELDDGRIFIAYYYTLPDGNNFGGTRFIAGSHFRIR